MIKDFKKKYQEIQDRKRAELQAAIENDEIHDPITTILISAAISAALSAASYAITAALTPKQPPRQTGKLQGSIQLQNSEQGIFIPEIYGGGPGATFVTGPNPTYQNNANGTEGADGSFIKSSGGATAWDCGASHNVAIADGDEVKFTVTRDDPYAIFGFTSDSSPTNFTDFLVGIQWNPDGSVTLQ